MQRTIKNPINSWVTQLPKVLLSMSMTLLFCTACNQSTTDTVNTNKADTSTTTTETETFDTTYRVVSNANYPPFEYLDEKGKIIGFDVDLLEAIGKEEGFGVAFQSQPWSVIFGELESGKADIVASSVWITDERKQKYGVSTPYFSSPMALLTLQNATQTNPVHYEDIHDSTIAVAIGGENDAFFKEFFGAKNTKLQSDSSYLALQEMMMGKANYISDAQVRLDDDISQYGDQLNSGESFAIVNDPKFPVWDWGFLVKKENTTLLNKINDGLAKVHQNGTYDKIYQKWFDGKAAPLVLNTQADDIQTNGTQTNNTQVATASTN